MNCQRCGKPLNENEAFCSICGAPRPAAAAQPQGSPAGQPYAQPAAARKKSKAPLLLLLLIPILLAAFLIAAVGGWFFVSHFLLDRQTPVTPPAPAIGVPNPETPSGASSGAVAGPGYDFSVMEGWYYCPDVNGSTLHITAMPDGLYIEKWMGSSGLDIAATIDGPDGPAFSFAYDGQTVQMYFDDSARSFTVQRGYSAEVFTWDGDVYWNQSDPFSDPDAYILPTDTRYIEEYELYPYDAEQIKLIRNEIFARYGYSFTMDKFRSYFMSKNWYWENPSVNVSTFSTDQFNDYERANLDLIRAYEERMGWK